MPLPYDAPRRPSPGDARSPPQFARGPLDLPPTPSYAARHMPPPSPPQMAGPPPSSIHMGSAPRGPPTVSPFAGVRDLASHRPTMSLSNILGGDEERKPASSPHSAAAAPAATPKSMQPPSPGRARSASMREGQSRAYRDASPPRGGMFGPMHRAAPDFRRDDVFGSPAARRDLSQTFRPFQPLRPENMSSGNAYHLPGRPSSQPLDLAGPRRTEESMNRDAHVDNRIPMFRAFDDMNGRVSRNEPPQQHDRLPFQNGFASQTPPERPAFGGPQTGHEVRAHTTAPYHPGAFTAPLRDEVMPLFRPTYQPTSHPVAEVARESIETRAPDMRRQLSRPSPPPADVSAYERARNGYPDRPMTLEEHQRMDAIQRESLIRKESDGSMHRAILNISPELNRKGRNSPLPQAVQGAQPRPIGPGGDNPGIKMEFGRMFSGLGSGVGSATPAPAQSMNGISTPSRMSPARQVESGDRAYSAAAAAAPVDMERSVSLPGMKGGRTGARRSRDDMEHGDADEQNSPDRQRGTKRTKTPHHHHHHHVYPHHHHHHHHEPAELAPGSFNTLRFPSNPPSAAHHHHHHHHTHPEHHYHPTARPIPAPRRPSISVVSKQVIDGCAGKPRKHLGSQLYTTDVSMPSMAEMPHAARIKFSSTMKSIPLFEGKENCTFTVRVPRYFLAASATDPDGNYSLEEICKRRQVWGTDIYTDDSDVVAAAVHAGWFRGDFGEYNDDIQELCDGGAGAADDNKASPEAMPPLRFDDRPPLPVKIPEGYDAHITVLILPPLQSYEATHQHHLWSREWKKVHDGMSYTIHRVQFVQEGPATRYTERGAAARKQRLALEDAKRRDAAAGLLMFASGPPGGTGTVSVGA